MTEEFTFVVQVEIEGQSGEKPLIHGTYTVAGFEKIVGPRYGPDDTWRETFDQMKHCFAFEIRMDILCPTDKVETCTLDMNEILTATGKSYFTGPVDISTIIRNKTSIGGFRCSVQDFRTRLRMYEEYRGDTMPGFRERSGHKNVIQALQDRERGISPTTTGARSTGRPVRIAPPPTHTTPSSRLSPAVIIQDPLDAGVMHYLLYLLCLKQSVSNELSPSVVRILLLDPAVGVSWDERKVIEQVYELYEGLEGCLDKDELWRIGLRWWSDATPNGFHPGTKDFSFTLTG
jgi:hypothetical protein